MKNKSRKLLSSALLAGALALFALIPGALTSANLNPRVAAPIKPGTATASSAKSAASAAFARLQSASRETLAGQIARQTGAFAFVRAPRGVLASDNAKSAPEQRALTFLASNGALLGLSDTERSALTAKKAPADGSELKVARTNTDSLKMTHVRFDQKYRNLPVFGAQVIVHMNERGITAVNGHFVPNISLSPIPALNAKAAQSAAVMQLRKQNRGADLKAQTAELGVYPRGLLEGYQVTNTLAYAVDVSGGKSPERVWIDANNGALLLHIPRHETALNRTIYSPQYDPNNPDLFVQRREGDPPHPAPFVNNLYDFAGQTYNFYSSAFGRDSFDGLGHKMFSVYLINQQCPNAYWDGQSTNYCPAFDADDVVSHEWSHAYTEYTHGLVYAYQSGALNESYSDIFGESVDLLNGVDGIGGNNNAQPYPNGQRWLVGEDLGQEVQELLLRDMYDPDRLGDPGKVTSENYVCGSDDGGGVHTNSGVPNHAYALVVDGTQYYTGNVWNGQTISGIGLTKAAAIYFRAESVYQTPTTDFPNHDQSLMAACSDLIGAPLHTPTTMSATGTVAPEVINANDCQQVAKAMLAVEMSTPSVCPLGPVLSPDAPPLCTGAADIFSENWESGTFGGWTKTSAGFGTGAVDWDNADHTPYKFFVLTNNLPGGRTGYAAFAPDRKVGEPGGGTCMPGGDYSGSHTLTSPAITIPAGANSIYLSFDHYVVTEATVDGGQVEVSVNGGAYNLIPQDQYSFNAPRSQYGAPAPVGNNTGPNPSEYAWNGTNLPAGGGSWGTTLADLSSIAAPGDTIHIRFTWSQDGCNGVEGWYVDNIRVFDCPNLTAPVLSLGADYQNPDPDGQFTLNWTRPPGAAGPDTLQVSQTSCAPIISDDAESGTTRWTAANDGVVAPKWQTSTKPSHSSTTFWAMPNEEGEGSATFTFNNPIAIPAAGRTYLSFSEFYFNETGDQGLVEVSTDNGATWATVYKNTRDMGALTDEGATAFATEDLTRRTLDLTGYGGRTIRLRFNFIQGSSDYFLFVTYGWYIDDIVLQNDNWTDVVTTNATSYTTSKGTGSYCYRVNTNYVFGNDVVPSVESNVVNAVVAPGVIPVVSRKVHGAAGTYDIPLPMTGDAGIESRQGGGTNFGNYQVVFQFPQAVTYTGASVTPGAGKTAEVDSATTSGNEVSVYLKNVSDRQTLQVSLLNVNNGSQTANVTVPMRVIVGDTNGNGTVNATDISQTKRNSGQNTGAGNFRTDVNVSGQVNGTDVSVVKAHSG